MQAWFEALSQLQKLMFLVGTAAAIALVAQLVLLLFGAGHDDSFDSSADLSGDAGVDGDSINDSHLVDIGSIKLFTMRSLLAFLAVGGFSGLSAIEFGASNFLGCLVAIAAGALAGFLVAYTLHRAMRLQKSGNISLKNAVGLTGSVYIPIGGGRSSVGKVNITLQHRLIEVEAITDDEQTIATMRDVRIIGVQNQALLVTAQK